MAEKKIFHGYGYNYNKERTEDSGRQTRPYMSPLRLLLIVGISTFLIEAFVMMLFHFVPEISEGTPFVHALIDATLLILILSPVLYFFLFRPLMLHIEERMHAEEELREEKDRAQRYLDIAGVMIVVLDGQGRVSLINRKGCEILGYSEGEIIGRDWFSNFIPERLRAEVKMEFESLVKGGREYGGYFENPVLTRSGEERMILWNNTTLFEKGVCIGTLSSGEDITERKKAEALLRESETRYRLVHNTSFDGLIISDATDRVIDANRSAEKIFGYGPGEMTGLDIVRLMPEAYRQRHRDGLRHFLETGISSVQGKVLELEGLKKNGEAFPIELVLTSFTIGGSINFTGAIRDIAERKRAEKEKEEIQALLNQSQKMEAIGRFAGGIAHDFNNILTAIRGNAEMALEDIDKSNPAYQRLEGVILSVMHASKLTRQLLLFSRGQPFELVPLDINRVIENLLIMITRLIGDGITVSTDLDKNLWMVNADEGNIEQVIMNLAVNAKDAMPDGGTLAIKTQNVVLDEKLSRSIPGSRPGRAICLNVSDTGHGMEKEVVSRIFEPFFTTKEKGKGIGFGLALVYGVVKQHGGWITVESEPSRGTTFKVFLPALPVKPEETVSFPHRLQGKGERILLVEDDDRIREFAKTALRENGYEVFDASTAKEAIEAFEREGGMFHLVFSDAVLSDQSGFQLVDQLLSIRPGFAVLLTSTITDFKHQPNAIHVKGYRYLQKPYSLSGLLRAVSISIEQSKINR